MGYTNGNRASDKIKRSANALRIYFYKGDVYRNNDDISNYFEFLDHELFLGEDESKRVKIADISRVFKKI
ncbi:MAG: hypothetical protein U9N59_15825 [Campylobacterota bacterium]|nr:hypothetical protein [Campylobacterota bacterium]